MSTYQPGLDQFDTREEIQKPEPEHERVLRDRGAVYGQPSERASKEVSGPSNVCLNCDVAIPYDVARVVGDENGCVPVCGGCDETRGSTVQAVAEFHRGGR